MKLSVFHHHLLMMAKEENISPQEAYRRAAAMGISAVDVNLEELIAVPALPTLIKEAGLGFSSIHAYYKFSERDESERIKLHMETAVAIGAPCVMVIPDFYPEGEIPADIILDPTAVARFFDASSLMATVLDGMREAVRVGKENGIRVTVEDYDHRDSPTATSAEIRYLLERVEGLFVTFDTGNFIFSDEDIEEAFSVLADKTVNLHLKDRGEDATHTGKHLRGLAPVAVGDGYLAIAPILSALRDCGYRGFLTVEHFGVPCYREAIERSVGFLSNFLS